MSRWLLRGFLVAGALVFAACASPEASELGGKVEQASVSETGPVTIDQAPYIAVLGIAQDGGIPQIGGWDHPAWQDASQARKVTSLGLIDPESGKRWLFDATPDLRTQLPVLRQLSPDASAAPNGGLTGIFLTHAHLGHYSGLAFLGHEVMGANGVDVFAMPRFRNYLETNGPWDQLVRYENIRLQELTADQPVALTPTLRVVPFVVPHRQEYSEVVGYRIEGPTRSVLFLPDIDSWHEWEAQGVDLEQVLGSVDVAYVDATFYSDGEVGGRDMSGFPHPFISHTMQRLADAPRPLRERVRFIHLNHTNPAQRPDSEARRTLEAAGFRVASEGEIVSLGPAL